MKNVSNTTASAVCPSCASAEMRLVVKAIVSLSLTDGVSPRILLEELEAEDAYAATFVCSKCGYNSCDDAARTVAARKTALKLTA